MRRDEAWGGAGAAGSLKGSQLLLLLILFRQTIHAPLIVQRIHKESRGKNLPWRCIHLPPLCIFHNNLLQIGQSLVICYLPSLSWATIICLTSLFVLDLNEMIYVSLLNRFNKSWNTIYVELFLWDLLKRCSIKSVRNKWVINYTCFH